ncbi:caspase family protein [Mesorhizobium sp.]|uniref:caspase family protein n=1 Tax=Mesorhizobium sp. TaxID=1871066 RepID=UPI00338DC148
MRVCGLFIGVDRHANPLIRDLTGAARDATALCALFRDSIEGLEAKLLVNEEARHASLRTALEAALVDAPEDGVVILGFAGHGTKDHRLVAHDTSVDDIPGTSIDMGTLASLFRRCRARAVICMLDCCFSGGAAARVLDIGLAARAMSLGEVAGQGRLLFTASLPGVGTRAVRNRTLRRTKREL